MESKMRTADRSEIVVYIYKNCNNGGFRGRYM